MPLVGTQEKRVTGGNPSLRYLNVRLCFRSSTEGLGFALDIERDGADATFDKDDLPLLERTAGQCNAPIGRRVVPNPGRIRLAGPGGRITDSDAPSAEFVQAGRLREVVNAVPFAHKSKSTSLRVFCPFPYDLDDEIMVPEDKMTEQQSKRMYQIATDAYGEYGVDTETAIEKLQQLEISIHCWQGDDVAGFERTGPLTGGIMATGNYPGKATTPEELRADFAKAYSLIPGSHRCNLHAMYLEHGGKSVDRDEIEPGHFDGWIAWAKELGVKLDFNPTFFSHPKSDDGFTLSHQDPAIRSFWVEHGKRSRRIAAHMGAELRSACVNNFWMPDGSKDQPADRLVHRELLLASLDEIFETSYSRDHTLDAVESKLFGIGSESYVVGSHEFYLAYAQSRKLVLCMDAGHYHPTESIAEKISALLPFFPRLLLHVSRPVRWDSDHVVLFDDETRAIMREVARAEIWNRVSIALDFFDASINRIGAWVTGTRAAMKSALFALLEPRRLMVEAERTGKLGDRLAISEEAKTLPLGAVWDEFCRRNDVPSGKSWLEEISSYERDVLAKRS